MSCDLHAGHQYTATLNGNTVTGTVRGFEYGHGVDLTLTGSNILIHIPHADEWTWAALPRP